MLHRRQFFLKTHELFDLLQKPAVNLRELENLFDDEAGGGMSRGARRK
jgi:hypothetical protein